MSLSEEAKKEIQDYVQDQEKIRQELISQINYELTKKLDDPNRELTENEKKLIKRTTKSYNTIIVIITAITAVSIVFIANLYSSYVKNDLKITHREQLDTFQVELDGMTDKFKGEINSSIKEGKSQIKDIVYEYKDDSKNLTLKRGELAAYNKVYTSRELELNTLLASLESGLTENSELKLDMEELLSSLDDLVKSTQQRTNEIEQKLSASDQVIELIETAQNLEVKEIGNHKYIIFGDLFIQWGNGTLSGKNTRIDVLVPVSDPNNYSVSVVGEDMRNKSIPEIVDATEKSFGITLWDKNKNNIAPQKNILFRYTLVGRKVQ